MSDIPSKECGRCSGFLVASYVEGCGGELRGESFCSWRCVNCGELFDAQILSNRAGGQKRSLARRNHPRGPAAPHFAE